MISEILLKKISIVAPVKRAAKYLTLLLFFSAIAKVSVAQVPANDNPCTAIELTPATTCTYQTYTNLNATASTGMSAPGCAGYSGGDVWFKVVVPAGGALTFDSQQGSLTDGGMAIYRGNSCSALVRISCDDNSSANVNMPKITVTGLTPGTTVYARFWENGNNNNGTFGICVTIPPVPPVNDNPCTATELTPSATCTYQTFSNEAATNSLNITDPGCGNYQGGDVWFKVVVPAIGALIFDTQTGFITNGGMALYTGTSCGGLTLLSCDDDGSANGLMPKLIAGSLNPGDTIWVRFWQNGNTANGTFGICVALPPPPPANDGPCAAIELPVNANCTFQTFSNADATPSSGPPPPGCANYLGNDVWFKAVVPAGGAINFEGQAGPTLTNGGMAVYSGTCDNLTLLNCDDDAGVGLMPKLTLGGLTPGDTLWVRFWDNGNTHNGTFGICASVPPPAPTNDEPCTSSPLTANATCTFQQFTNENSTGTSGPPAPGCASFLGGDVWFNVVVPAGGALNFDTQTGVITDGGMALYTGTCDNLSLLACDDDASANGNMPKLTVGGLTPGDTIWVRFWAFDNAEHGSFGICVSIPPPAPANDDPCGAILLTVDSTCNANTFSNESALGTTGVPAPACAGYSGGDVWFKTVVPVGGAISFDSQAGVMLDGGMAVYSGNCGNLTELGCDDNTGAGNMPKLTLGGLTPGDTLWIRFWENGNNNNGTFSICLTIPPPPPANDDPCTAIELPVGITCNPQTFTNENATNSSGVPAPLCANYLGSDVWFKVVVPAGGTLIFESQEAFITDGGMALYSGSCTGGLTLISCDDDSGPLLMPKLTATGLTPGDTIWVRYWEYLNDHNGTFGICVRTPPPPPVNDDPCGAIQLNADSTCTYQTFTTESSTGTVGAPAPGCGNFQGSDIWFKVVVPAGGALSFDSQSGVITDGAMAIYTGRCDSLTLAACDDNTGAGSMPKIIQGGLIPGDTVWVRFWEWGNDNNGTFGICISIPPPPPANDEPCNAVELTPAATCTYQTFTNASAFGSTGIPAPGCANYTGGDVWFKVVVPAGGSLIFDTQAGVMTDGGMALYKGTCSSLHLLACDDNSSANGNMPSIEAGGLHPGDTIWVRMWENGNDNNGTFGICVTIPPAGPVNDHPCDAITLIPASSCTYQTFTNVGAINTVGVPAPGCAGYSGGDIWFKATVPAEGGVIIDTHEGTMTDAGMALYTGNCDSLVLVSCDDNNSVNGSMPTIYATGLTPGTTVWIRVWENGNNNNGTFGICITIPPPQPSTLSFSCIRDTTIGCDNCFALTAKIPNIHLSTDDYVVNPLSGPGNCFKPYVGPDDIGPSTNLGDDDTYTDIINLPFAFPFYGTNYNALVASTNGYVSFDLTNAGAPSHYEILSTGGFLSALSGTPLNLPSTLYDKALIMGPYHDIDPEYTTSPNQQIKYNVTGIAPNRRWILSFYKVPLFSTACQNLIENTHQIVLYEGSGVVEVFVFDKQICPGWNDGRAMIGMQNMNATKGIMAPGRRASDPRWGSIGMNESWRFTPVAGPTLFKRVELYDTSGNLISTGDTSSIDAANLNVNFNNICPSIQKVGVTVYIVKTVYQQYNNAAGEFVSTDTIRVTRTAALNASYAISDASCNQGNGSIVVTASGAGSYTYSSNGGLNFQTDSNFVNLSAGVYHIVVKDSTHNCTRDTTITIAASSPVLASYIVTAATCNGSPTGSLVVSTIGNYGPYQYSVDGGVTFQADSTFALAAGTYHVIIKDANSCTKDTTVVISEPARLIPSAISTAATCNGSANGIIRVSQVGGTTPYEYSIDAGITYQTADSFIVAAGTYVIRVKDANGCTKDTSVVVTQPAAISPAFATTAVSCFGGNNGLIVVSVSSGGVSPFDYSIDNGATYQTSDSFAVAAGIHSIRVRDANGCTKDSTVEVLQPAAIIPSYTATAVSCNGGNNGSIKVIVNSGGVTPFEYSINGGDTYQSVDSFVNLAAGIHPIRIRDANGCIKDTTAEISEPTPIAATYTTTAVKCNGGSDGTITITAAGGTSPYQYSSDGGSNYQSGNSFALSAGSYTIRIKDANNCTKDSVITVSQPTVLAATNTTNDATCNPQPNGIITVAATGGTSSSYSYSIDNGATYQSSATFVVGQGNYIIQVKDANGCIATTPATVGFTFDLTLTGAKDTSICDNNSVRLNTVSNAQSYSWFPTTGLDDASIVSPTASPTVTTVYTLTAQTGSCILKDSVTVTVSAAPTVFAGDDVSVLKGEDASIFASVNNANSYTWSPTTYLSNPSSLSPVSVMPQETITYRLTATNSLGCTKYDEVVITVLPYCIKTKNAFTPNGDGVNDTWVIYDQYDCLRNVKVQVFNRYGSKVYESANYHNEWRGTFNGQSLPDATYYYVVDYTLTTGKVIQVRGDVTILR